MNDITISNKEIIAKHFEDRLATPVKDYIGNQSKTQGVSDGFIGQTSDNSQYMLKRAKLDSTTHSKKESTYKRDLMQEFITAPLYKRILFDNSPVIGLATTKEGDLYLKSKFLEGFQDLSSYLMPKATITTDIDNSKNTDSILILEDTKAKKIFFKLPGNKKTKILPISIDEFQKVKNTCNKLIENNGEIPVQNKEEKFDKFLFKALRHTSPEFDSFGHEKVAKIIGFQKTISACLFLGEIDYHAQNLGIVNGQIVKIDHGRSGMDFFKDESYLRKTMAQNFEDFGYQDFPFNAQEFRNCLASIISISDEEIEKLVRKQIDILKKQNFKLPETIEYYDGQKLIKIKLNNFQDLENFYISAYKANKQIFSKLQDTLETISQIEFSENKEVQQKWLNGKWLFNIKDEDPLIWAAKNGKRIIIKEGENLVKKDSLLILIEQKKLMPPLNQDPVEWAIISSRKIDGINPIMWADKNGYKIDGKEGKLSAFEEARELIKSYGKGNKVLEKTIKLEAREYQKELGKEIRNLGLKRFYDKNTSTFRQELINKQNKLQEIISLDPSSLKKSTNRTRKR